MTDLTDLLNQRLTSRLSSRRVVVREANRRGLLFGIMSRAGQPMGRREARRVAAQTMAGYDTLRNCAVPARWRSLFERIFVKSAVHAAHTDRRVTVADKQPRQFAPHA
jgi:hypothetical protein